LVKYIDLTGKTFGLLEVLCKAEKPLLHKGKEAFWNCKCVCGREKVINGDLLRKGKTKSCGCRGTEKWQAALNKLYSGYIRQAKDRNLIFSLNKEEFIEITSSCCYYCGSSPNQTVKHKGFRGEYVYNGIDRKDNEVGYISSNVVACCFICNSAKRTMPYENFKLWIEKIYHKILTGEIE